MSYSRGFLNTKISVLNISAATVGEFGKQGGTYATAGSCWANVSFSRGTKSMREGAYDAYDTIMVRCDCHSYLTRDSRLSIKGRQYNIQSFNQDDEANEVQITAIELSST